MVRLIPLLAVVLFNFWTADVSAQGCEKPGTWEEMTNHAKHWMAGATGLTCKNHEFLPNSFVCENANNKFQGDVFPMTWSPEYPYNHYFDYERVVRSGLVCQERLYCDMCNCEYNNDLPVCGEGQPPAPQ